MNGSLKVLEKELRCLNLAVWSLTTSVDGLLLCGSRPGEDQKGEGGFRVGITMTLSVLSSSRPPSPTTSGRHGTSSMRSPFTVLSFAFLAPAQQHFQ